MNYGKQQYWSTGDRLYYPCIYHNGYARIIKQVSKRAMTRGQCVAYLKRHYRELWLKCDAIPQPVTHPQLVPWY